jgi:hypothetical protein
MKNNFFYIFSLRNIASSLLIANLLISCGKQKIIEPKEKILVKIGDKSISVDEFIRRAEYTVRPPYCRGNYNLDKKIVLNSLIAEKLMAMEAGDSNPYVMSKNIQAYLRGRREQTMRQWLYEEEALKKAVIDTAQARKTFKVAGRKYKISYFNIPDSALAYQINAEMRYQGKSFKDVYMEKTGLDTLPHREVEWSVNEHDLVLDSLFSAPLYKNQVVGPIKIDKNQYMMMTVDGWIDRPAITETQVQERWRTITDEFSQRAADRLFDQFIHKVMQGKTIEFQPQVFFKVANLLGPIYFKTEAEKNEIMKKSFGEHNQDMEEYEHLQTEIEILYQESLFKVDGKVWTVKDFADELAVHPLVFRNKKMKKNEFGQQLQFAIMDMIRDKYLAEVAYKRGYDKINVIQRNVTMWQDNLSYQYYKEKYLRSVVPDTVKEMSYMPLIENYLNAQVDSLQKKYSNIIKVDVDAFNEIKLTRIDMSAIQENVPFPIVVPSFSLVTTDNRLDYGSRMSR